MRSKLMFTALAAVVGDCRERFALQVVHEFADAGDAVVSCSALTAGPTAARWSFLKVTAMRVATLSNGPFTLIPHSSRRSR
jgi:hypothetical protein